jgi:hypothetical protein
MAIDWTKKTTAAEREAARQADEERAERERPVRAEELNGRLAALEKRLAALERRP